MTSVWPVAITALGKPNASKIPWAETRPGIRIPIMIGTISILVLMTTPLSYLTPAGMKSPELNVSLEFVAELVRANLAGF
jgi:hypothetical protein